MSLCCKEDIAQSFKHLSFLLDLMDIRHLQILKKFTLQNCFMDRYQSMLHARKNRVINVTLLTQMHFLLLSV